MPTGIPVSHNPFAQTPSQGRVVGRPVSYNPFAQTTAIPEEHGIVGRTVGKVSDIGRSLGTGANEAIAGTLGLPVDAVTAVLNLAGAGIDKPFGGSESIRKIMPESYKPQGVTENVAKAVGEQVAGALIPLAGTLAYVNKTGKATGPIVKTLLGDLKKMPLVDILKLEAGMATTAGAASGLTRTQTDSPYADIAAQLVGGLGYAGAKGIIDVAKRAFTKEGIAKTAAKSIQESVVAPERYASNIEQAKKIEKGLGRGRLFTTAQATGTPGLIGAERKLIQKGEEAGFAGAIRTRRGEAAEKIAEYGQKLIPEGDVRDVEKAVMANRKMEEAKARLVADKYREISKLAEGENIHEALKAAKGEKRLEMDRLFDEISQVNPELPANSLKKALVEAATPYEGGGTANIPNALIHEIQTNMQPDIATQEILALPKSMQEAIVRKNPEVADELLRASEKGISFAAARKFKSRIQEAISQTENGEMIDRLKKISTALDETLDTLGTETGTLGGLYRTAKERYRKEYVPFKTGTAAEVLQRGKRGETTRIDAEDIAQKFLSGETQVRDFITTLGGNKPAREALRSAAMRDFIDNVFDEGTNLLSATKAKAWRNKHAVALRAFPDIRKEVENVDAIQKTLDEAVKTSLLVEGDLDKVIPSILKGANPTQKIMEIGRVIGKTPEAVTGLRRAVWNHALEGSQTTMRDIDDFVVYDPSKLDQIRKTHANIFKAIYTPDELKKMDTFTDAYKIFYRTIKPAYGTGSPVLENLNPTTERLVANASFFGGRIMKFPYYAATGIAQATKELATRYTTAQKEKLINEALLNPDVADAFIRMSAGAPVSYIKKRFDSALRNTGIQTGIKLGDIPREKEPEELQDPLNLRGEPFSSRNMEVAQ
ncbi:hypothetical protein [Candidatus Magnetobacterium casense]|uniref:Large polyvalent protein associated domain-containing protein n=1 Tax=Candidatus Magnetobacterium casense TaxID=1455061 RepID=A0ABS6RUY7_9BACT|nr:hypothetical protein [Candidatus Magnetobacterium casensis]MBV6340442.1 hypothetical protein [Candidatus Magnetobacterium casensis]